MEEDNSKDKREDFILLLNDNFKKASELSMEECIKSRLSKIKETHPDLSENEQKKLATQRCSSRAKDNKIKDAGIGIIPSIGIIGGKLVSGNIERVSNISLKKISQVIKLIKTKKSLKVGHAGILPFLSSLPMKNLNRLQTKLEKLFTQEARFLTHEQQEQRSRYAKMIKKKDSFRMTDQLEFTKVNTGLHNIIKAPIILAKEMVQPYQSYDEDGNERTEYHFKSYEELEKAVEGLDELPMIIEHQKYFGDEDVIGHVKQIVADDDLRAIRGMGYFYEHKLPPILSDILKEHKTVGVSIEFLASLGDGGIFNGENYDFTQRDIILENLAVCLESIPRCPPDSCGVNLIDAKNTTEVQKDTQFTIINKNNHYYNINKTIEETRKNNTELLKKSDSMKAEDSFPEPETGKISGYEPKEFEVMLSRLRMMFGGKVEIVDKDMARKKIAEILHMTDSDEGKVDNEPDTPNGDNEMDEKEFQDAIALKDAKIEELEKIVKETLKTDIKNFSDKYKDSELDESCIHDLTVIRDAVTRYQIPKEEAEVIPIESKEELKDELEKKENPQREDNSEMFTKINEEFDMTSF